VGARGPTGNGDADDWFGEPDWPANDVRTGDTGDGEEPVVEDWLLEAPPPEHARSFPGAVLAWIAGGLAFVGLLLGLALGGVFGGHTNSRQPTAATTPTTTGATTAATTTAPSPTASASSVPTQTLKPGDTGAQVRALQRALTSLGLGPGAVDGTYGPATTSALTRFQQAAGLTPDGVLGPKTLAALIKRAGP